MLASCGPFKSMETFAKWIANIYNVKTFFSKPVNSLEISPAEPYIIIILWKKPAKKKGIIAGLCYFESEAEACLNKLKKCAKEQKLDAIAFVEKELPEFYSSWAKIWIFNVHGPFLEPNNRISVQIYDTRGLSSATIEWIKQVQKKSWGFFVKPPTSDYVLLAFERNKPVGSAYFNPTSFNIDYGVHVAKEFWRRRIGTRLIVEASLLAEKLGIEWITAIRILRGKRPTKADKRAIAFYRANNPCAEINAYRLEER